ncbi:MAG: hypothetical protein DI551_01075 [Micavibrio aeruginosavorus]|uniref:Uncharacterized protein n=1 Tax=Micavibrio aeruginosavorus TaxID=349221 RepID=A0A2W5NDA1_9BACT|nr:MAG: hypothetical protein DI551_01075 [Micavibrio aeruginosavorus]
MSIATHIIPEKFKDPATGELKIDSLLTSYSELEKKMSRTPSVPKSHEEYCINCDHGYFGVDEELNKQLHAKGFTNDQVQVVYDLAAEKLVPLVVQMAADYNAEREIEKLEQQFGGAEKWREVSRQLLAFGQKALPADVLETLSSSFEGVMALYRMMKGEEPELQKPAGPVGASQNELDLQSMMRDPKYWRDQDPSFINKVTEGFQKLYGKR